MGRPGRTRPTRSLTEGAILAALTFVIAAVGLVAPFVGILLAPLPIMLLVIRWGVRTGLLGTIVAALLLLQFLGPISAVSAVAVFGPLGLALGWGVRRGLRGEGTILAGAAAILVSVLVVGAIVTRVLHQDLVGQIIQSQVKGLEMTLALEQRLGAPPAQIEELRKTIAILPHLVRAILPPMVPLSALMWTYFCYILARVVFRRIGYALTPVPAILHWRLSPLVTSALLWIVAGFSLVSLRDPRAAGIALGVMMVTAFVFGFQGALVGITWMNNRQIPRFAQVLAGVLLLSAGNLYPILALAILGVMDTWFDYRRLGRPAPSLPDKPHPEDAAGKEPEAKIPPVEVVHPR